MEIDVCCHTVQCFTARARPVKDPLKVQVDDIQ